jgi:hypothetical protein
MKEVNISQVDALFSNGIYPIEFLFYFKDGLDTRRIRNALKKITSAFWPVFGEYKAGIISFDKYDEKDFIDMEAVDQKFTIPATEKEKLAFYAQYRLPDTKKLSLFKITQFNNGMILVPKIKHLAGDGYSYFYFLSSLAVLSRRSLLPSKASFMQLMAKPHHRRTALKKFVLQRFDLNPVKQSNQFAIAADEILRKDIQSRIRSVSESKNFRISTNDVLSAMALKKLTGAQEEFQGETIELTIPIDVRRHVKDYGRRFFGNGIMLHKLKLKRDDIKRLAVEEMAAQIRQAMPSVSEKSYIDYLTQLERLIDAGNEKKLRPFDPATGCLVTNISRLPVERLDFGSGPPDLVFPLTIEKNGAAVLAKDENFILRYAY